MTPWDGQFDEIPIQHPLVWLTLGIVLFVLLLSGPVGGVDFTGEPATLGDGNASVTVVEPAASQLRVTEGRSGTNVTYVRVPDAVVDVERVTGQPRIVYSISIPGLVDRQATRYVESTGRLRVSLADKARPTPPEPGTYRGTLTIRVQSFTGETVAVDRRIEVVVE